MLENRKVIATMGNEQVTKDVEDGAPQGGVVSGNLLWNGTMEDLLRRFPKRDPSEKEAFADDVLVVATGIDERTVTDNVQRDVKILEEWAKDQGLTFSHEKTKAMMVTRRINVTRYDILVNNQPVEYVDSYKYLGIEIDSKLLWNNHLKKSPKRQEWLSP